MFLHSTFFIRLFLLGSLCGGRVTLIKYLCSEGKLRYYIFLGLWITVEGVVFGGDIKAVKRFYVAVVVFYVKAVSLYGRSLYAIFLSAVFTRKNKSFFGIVNDLACTESFKFPASGQRIYLHLVLKGVASLVYLPFDLFTLPQEPIGNMGKFGLTLKSAKVSVLLKLPAFAAMTAEDLRTLGLHP